MEKLLEVKDLKVSFFTDLGETQAVKDAGFAIEEGDFFGIVGESGSGKSVTTKSILRLGPSNCRIMGGEILFQGEDILKKSGEYEPVRWKSYIDKVDAYQGEIVSKSEVLKQFKLKVKRSQDQLVLDEWEECDLLLREIFAAFEK